jgi:hypothetical protein
MKETHHFPKQVLEYIRHHENADPYLLALKNSPFSDVSMKTIAQQIQGRRIAKGKFPFLLNFDQYRYPVKQSIEQASSEHTAKFKSNLIKGRAFVDLTGGMGIDSYLLGRNFQFCTYVEPDTDLFDITTQNFKTLEFEQCKMVNLNCTSFLASNTNRYDWAYIDPSRRIDGKRKISLYNYEPNIVELAPQICDMAENVMVKLSPMQDISECLDVIKNVQKVWVISFQNEVKELLLHIRKDSNPAPLVKAVELKKDETLSFSFAFEERNYPAKMGNPMRYLYQPGAAIVKAELHNRYAHKRELYKLHANTQLFTSESLQENFIGKVFYVKEYISLNKKEIKHALPQMKANIVSKNFPLSPIEISRKYKLKFGGQDYLIAFTDVNEKKRVAICNRVY